MKARDVTQSNRLRTSIAETLHDFDPLTMQLYRGISIQVSASSPKPRNLSEYDNAVTLSGRGSACLL